MIISIVALILVQLSFGYWIVLALASIRAPARPVPAKQPPSTRFPIALPAHDEAPVIAATVRRLCSQDYPAGQFAIYVVADHCSDDTAAQARQAGAIVYERNHGP